MHGRPHPQPIRPTPTERPAPMVGSLAARVAITAVATVLALPSAAPAADMSPATRKEIDHMLARVVSSGCEFGRGSTWHSGPDARVHLERKLGYLSTRGMVASAEDFIAMAATRSSMTGEPYAIRCKANPPQPSAAWMEAELKALRATTMPPATGTMAPTTAASAARR